MLGKLSIESEHSQAFFLLLRSKFSKGKRLNLGSVLLDINGTKKLRRNRLNAMETVFLGSFYFILLLTSTQVLNSAIQLNRINGYPYPVQR